MLPDKIDVAREEGYARGLARRNDAVIRAVIAEEQSQDGKWGEQNHPNGTGLFGDKEKADFAREVTDDAARNGTLTWKHILNEEVLEAFAESDLDRLEEELIQVAAVSTQWARAIHRQRNRLDHAPIS